MTIRGARKYIPYNKNLRIKLSLNLKITIML